MLGSVDHAPAPCCPAAVETGGFSVQAASGAYR